MRSFSQVEYNIKIRFVFVVVYRKGVPNVSRKCLIYILFVNMINNKRNEPNPVIKSVGLGIY